MNKKEQLRKFFNKLQKLKVTTIYKNLFKSKNNNLINLYPKEDLIEHILGEVVLKYNWERKKFLK